MSEENTNATPANSPQPQKAKEKKPTEKTPAKSPRITNSQKEKDPRKVAAGKKLAAISKMAKSQKKYKAEAHDASEEREEATKIPSFYMGMAVCVVVGVLGIAYFKTRTTGDNNSPKNPNPNPKQNPKQNPNLISLE